MLGDALKATRDARLKEKRIITQTPSVSVNPTVNATLAKAPMPPVPSVNASNNSSLSITISDPTNLSKVELMKRKAEEDKARIDKLRNKGAKPPPTLPVMVEKPVEPVLIEVQKPSAEQLRLERIERLRNKGIVKPTTPPPPPTIPVETTPVHVGPTAEEIRKQKLAAFRAKSTDINSTNVTPITHLERDTLSRADKIAKLQSKFPTTTSVPPSSSSGSRIQVPMQTGKIAKIKESIFQSHDVDDDDNVSVLSDRSIPSQTVKSATKNNKGLNKSGVSLIDQLKAAQQARAKILTSGGDTDEEDDTNDINNSSNSKKSHKPGQLDMSLLKKMNDAFQSTLSPLSDSSAVTNADSNTDKYEVYRKMKKMRTPDIALRQKMTMDGISNKEIDDFLAGKYDIPPKMLTSLPTTNTTYNLTTDPKYGKYMKMMVMKLPEGAVLQKMRQDGMTQSDIDIFFQTLKSSENNKTTRISLQMKTTSYRETTNSSNTSGGGGNKYAKYTTMLKNRTSEDVVKKAMTDDGLSSIEIDIYFKTFASLFSSMSTTETSASSDPDKKVSETNNTNTTNTIKSKSTSRPSSPVTQSLIATLNTKSTSTDENNRPLSPPHIIPTSSSTSTNNRLSLSKQIPAPYGSPIDLSRMNITPDASSSTQQQDYMEETYQDEKEEMNNSVQTSSNTTTATESTTNSAINASFLPKPRSKLVNPVVMKSLLDLTQDEEDASYVRRNAEYFTKLVKEARMKEQEELSRLDPEALEKRKESIESERRHNQQKVQHYATLGKHFLKSPTHPVTGTTTTTLNTSLHASHSQENLLLSPTTTVTSPTLSPNATSNVLSLRHSRKFSSNPSSRRNSSHNYMSPRSNNGNTDDSELDFQ